MSDVQDIPAFQLYGEMVAFPDILHMEQIRDRAAGLDWTIRPHRHTHLFQVFLLQSGQVSFQVDGDLKAISPPVALCVPPGFVHGFSFSSDTEGWVISLPVQHYPDLFGSSGELGHTLAAPLVIPHPPDFTDATTALFQVWLGNAQMRRTVLRCRFGLLLSELSQAAPDVGAEPGQTDPRMSRFLALIAECGNQHLPISAYARSLGVSERSLARISKAQTGLSPQALVETQLMREASRLLAYTQMSAQSVAHQLGFEDASYFSRRFRRYAGVSPGVYRQQLNQP